MSIKVVLVLLLATCWYVTSQGTNQLTKQTNMNAIMQLMKARQTANNNAANALNNPFTAYSAQQKLAEMAAQQKLNNPFQSYAVRTQVKNIPYNNVLLQKPYQPRPYYKPIQSYYKPTQSYYSPLDVLFGNTGSFGSTGGMDMNNLLTAHYMADYMDNFL